MRVLARCELLAVCTMLAWLNDWRFHCVRTVTISFAMCFWGVARFDDHGCWCIKHSYDPSSKKVYLHACIGHGLFDVFCNYYNNFNLEDNK